MLRVLSILAQVGAHWVMIMIWDDYDYDKG